MPDILAYGFPLDSNFGGPSVVHGLRDALTRLYPDHELVVYQHRKVDPLSVSDLDFPVRFFPYWKEPLKFYLHWIMQKLFRRLPRSASRAQFWKDYRKSDVVANIYAICFCSNLRTYMSTQSKRASLGVFLQAFGIGLVARLDGKRSVKTTSSYGPVTAEPDAYLARLVCRHGVTRVVAREEESRRQLVEEAHVSRPVRTAPDLANAWRSSVVPSPRPRLGFSVSFQSEIQWERQGLDYVAFMRDLVLHAKRTYGCDVVLLPNQLFRVNGRTDIAVAESIRDALPEDCTVELFDALKVSPTGLRDALVSCTAMVSCRYHTCVASFAAGVPTLILGWHVKYDELARWYGQEKWILRTEDCAKMDVKAVMDRLWTEREQIRADILAHRPAVDTAVLESVRYLFGEP